MNLSTVSWIDLVMVLVLVGSIGFGFHQGLLRQAVLLAAIYIATILSSQYYEQAAEWMAVYLATDLEMDRVISFALLYVAFTVVATWLIWSAYQQTRLPSVVMLDEAGGAALGGIIGVFVIGLTLTLAQYAAQAPWPAGGPVKELLHMGLVNSALDEFFRSAVPIIQAVIRPWLPSGLPALLGS